MRNENSLLTRSAPVKIWQLYLVRFLLLFFAWTSTDLAFESAPAHLVWKTVTRAFLFSVVVLSVFLTSSGHSTRIRRLALILLAVLGCLIAVQAWKGASAPARAQDGSIEGIR